MKQIILAALLGLLVSGCDEKPKEPLVVQGANLTNSGLTYTNTESFEISHERFTFDEGLFYGWMASAYNPSNFGECKLIAYRLRVEIEAKGKQQDAEIRKLEAMRKK
jgi:hypothetical protein